MVDVEDKHRAAVPAGSRWRHRKGGTYRVVTTATEEAARTTVVVYQADADGQVWTRAADDFTDGRFERLADAVAGNPDPLDPAADLPATDSREMYDAMCDTYDVKPEYRTDPVVVGLILGTIGSGQRQAAMTIHAAEVAKAYWAAELGRLRRAATTPEAR